MARISSYLYGILIIGLFMSMIAFVMLGFYENDSTLRYNSGNLSSFNKLDEMSSLSNQMRNETLLAKTESGTLDKLGAFFTNGYQTMKLTLSSLDVGVGLANDGVKHLGLGEPGEVIKGVAITMLILAIIFAIIYILVKVEV